MRNGRLAGPMLAAFLISVGLLAFLRPAAVMRAGLVLAALYLLGLLFGCGQRTRHLHGVLLPLGFLGMGGMLTFAVSRVFFGSAVVLALIACVCLGLSVSTLVSPRFGKRLFELWIDGAHPIGWCVSNLLLAMVYYLAITPLSVVLRLLGRDPMARRFEREEESYWMVRAPRRDLPSYFRQF